MSGQLVSAAALAAAAAAVLTGPAIPSAWPRMATLLPPPRARRPGRANPRRSVPPLLAAVVAGVAVGWLVGGGAGIALGLAAGGLLDRLVRRLPSAAERMRAGAVAADLPLALDLLGACLEAGSPLGPAVDAVGTALGGPLGNELADVAASMRLGSPPEQAWSRLAADPVVRPVARAVVRVSDSGAALAPLVHRLAEEQRDRARLSAEAAARRAGVLVVAPLGLCFLPAFLLLGVAPVVLGLASAVLG